MFGFIKNLVKEAKDSMHFFECPRCGQEHKIRVFRDKLTEANYSFVTEGSYKYAIVSSSNCSFCKANIKFLINPDNDYKITIDIEQQEKEKPHQQKMKDAEKDIEKAEDDLDEIETEILNLNEEYKENKNKEIKEKIKELKAQLPELKKAVKTAESAYQKLEKQEEKIEDAYTIGN